MHLLASFEDTETLLKLLNAEYAVRGHTLQQHRNMGGIVYFLHSATQRFVFKIFRAINTENALQSIRILKYLSAEDYPAVRIIPTISGTDHLVLHCPEGECTGVLYPFIEGEEVEGISHENAAELGEQVARLHRLMLSPIAPRLVHRGKEFYVDRFIQLLERDQYDPARIREFAEYGNELWSNLAPLPQGFCHGCDDLWIFLCHPCHQFGLNEGAGHGFFDIDMFSELHCSHAYREVGKVGYGNLNGINISCHRVEHNPEIPELFCFGTKLYCFLGTL